MQGTARDCIMCERITKLLEEQGIVKTRVQVNNKLKSLKRQYHQAVHHNNRSGNDHKTFPYYALCETIWGSRHSTRPVALSATMPEAGSSQDTASTSSSDCPQPNETASDNDEESILMNE